LVEEAEIGKSPLDVPLLPPRIETDKTSSSKRIRVREGSAEYLPFRGVTSRDRWCQWAN